MAARLGIKGYAGCFSDDTIPDLDNKEGCVVNLQSAGEPGTHWCAIKRFGKTIYHFDSLGFPADQPIVEYADDQDLKIKSKYIRLQQDNSHYCGHYCLLFLLCVEEPDDIPIFYNQFAISEDADALKLNDKQIRDIAVEW